MTLNSMWKIRGTRNGQPKNREVRAPSLIEAVTRASKGTGFMLVKDCVLIDPFSHAELRARATRAYTNGLQINLPASPN